MGEFASNGKGNLGVTLGAIGTGFGILNGGLGNIGGCGGLFGGNRNGNCCEPLETRESSCLRQQVAALQAEKYADNVGIATFKSALELSNRNDDLVRANQKEAFQAIAALDKQAAVNQANLECITAKLGETVGRVNVLETKTCDNKSNIQSLAATIDALAAETKSGLMLEAERRHAADESIRCWVKGTYVPGTLSLSPDSMCPKPVTCCDVLQYFNAGGTPPVPSPCGCQCGAAPAAPAARSK